MIGQGSGAATLAADAGALVAQVEIWVRTDAESVAAFRRETCGSTQHDAVPLTYPFCWLTMPEIRPTLERMIGGAEFLPVHEAQSFDYQQPLEIDADYRLAFTFKRSTEPLRLTVNVEISPPAAAPSAQFETVLRLVPTASAAVADD